MRTKSLTIALALLASVTLSHANIISANFADDGDGVLTCQSYWLTQTGPTAWSETIDGTHNLAQTGNILGNIVTDTEADPSLTLANEIDNDTGAPWTDYHVTLTMSKSFTLSGVTVANAGWTVHSIVGPTQVGSSYIGTINYICGTPVDNLGTLDFNFTMTFTGSASFEEDLTPSYEVVPEPGTLALLAGGLLSLFVLRRRA